MDITEDWIKSRVKLAGENYANVKTLILQGTYDAKILNLGNSLLRFTRLKILDLSRNLLKSTKGIEHIYTLEVLNLYYNSIENLMEVRRLQENYNLKDLDLRLNPISRMATDYRLCLIYILPKLKKLDCRTISDSERRAAFMSFHTSFDAEVSYKHSLSEGTLANVNVLNLSKSAAIIPFYIRSLTERLFTLLTTEDEPAIVPMAQKALPHPVCSAQSPMFQCNQYTDQSISSPNGLEKSGIGYAEYYSLKELLQAQLEAERPQKDHFRQKTITSGQLSSMVTNIVQRFADNMVDKRDSGDPDDHPLSTHDKSDIHRDVTSTEPSSAEPGNHRSGLHDAPVNDLIKSISDRALFTLLKNWIQEAVSETFARHARSNPSSVLKDTDSVSRNEDHDTRSDRFQFYKPAAGPKIKTASEYGSVVENRKLHFMEDRDTSRQVKALEEENSRLAMEVRVLRSRLQKYEQSHRRDRTLLVPNSSSNMDNPPNRSLVPDVPTGKYFSAFVTPGLYPIDRCLQPTSHTSSGYLTGSTVFNVYGNKPKPWISDTPKPSPST